MSALAGLRPADRRRLTGRLAELRAVDSIMREPGGLAAAPEPEPLHRLAERLHRQDRPQAAR
jgi:hypothetical protein